MKTKNENAYLHKGHRARLKNTYKENGINALHPHEALELLLFFGIPYKDTNEIAHQLINHFGSLPAVFEANIQDLKCVKNMTENAAILINLFSDIAKLYLSDSLPRTEVYDTKEKISDFLFHKFFGLNEEKVLLMLLDSSNHLIDWAFHNEGSATLSSVNIGKVVKIANSRNASKVVLAHNHPDNSALSTNDIVTSRKIAYHLNGVDIKFIDCFVVTQNEVFSTLDSMPVGKKRKKTKKEEAL